MATRMHRHLALKEHVLNLDCYLRSPWHEAKLDSVSRAQQKMREARR